MNWLREWAKVEWDAETRRWQVVKVTETPVQGWESYSLAVAQAKAYGWQLVGVPHFCFPGCDHPPLPLFGSLWLDNAEVKDGHVVGEVADGNGITEPYYATMNFPLSCVRKWDPPLGQDNPAHKEGE